MPLMAIATRSYGGVTADERRATRRVALIEAALDLFAEDGARAVSKRAVCARARLNDRYFYEHFTDSDALIEAIVRDLTAEGLQAVKAATRSAAPDLRAQVRATADAALEFLTADPRRGQLLLRSHTSEVLQRARVDSTHAISNAMAAMIRVHSVAAAGQPARHRPRCVCPGQRCDGGYRWLATWRLRHQP